MMSELRCLGSLELADLTPGNLQPVAGGLGLEHGRIGSEATQNPVTHCETPNLLGLNSKTRNIERGGLVNA